MEHQIARNKRMSAVVVVLFLALWLVVGVIVGWLIGSVGFGVIVALAVAGAVALWSWAFGALAALTTVGAVPADPELYRVLHDIVEAEAIGAGIPKPHVFVMDDPSPNAFATGRDPRRAAVTVTTGLLAMMDREELEGVIAHELSHIRNYDVRLVLLVATMVGAAGFLGSVLLRGAWGSSDDEEGGGFGLALLAGGLLLMLLGYVFGPIMQFALSRHRESLADASGVELTRNPAGLLSALRKLQANERPVRHFNAAVAPMFIDNPLEHHRHFFNHLFDTHPPIEERIAALERILEVRET